MNLASSAKVLPAPACHTPSTPAAAATAPHKLAIDVRAAAQLCGGLSTETLLRAVRHRKLQAIRCGRRVLFREADLKAWLDGMTQPVVKTETDGNTSPEAN